MSSRETQRLILDSALRLFNQHGSPNVSTNRIAEDCGISKGNLNYHFRTKQEIVLTLFWQMSQEVNVERAAEEGLADERLALFYARQLGNAWRYRFFVREAAALLREQPILRRRFGEWRRRNAAEWRRVLMGLTPTARLRIFPPEGEFELLLGSIFVHCDHWLHALELQDEPIDEVAFSHGYETFLLMVGPYLSDVGRAALSRASLIAGAASQFLAHIAPAPSVGRLRPSVAAQGQAIQI